jgi:hypothetical protein
MKTSVFPPLLLGAVMGNAQQPESSSQALVANSVVSPSLHSLLLENGTAAICSSPAVPL